MMANVTLTASKLKGCDVTIDIGKATPRKLEVPFDTVTEKFPSVISLDESMGEPKIECTTNPPIVEMST